MLVALLYANILVSGPLDHPYNIETLINPSHFYYPQWLWLEKIYFITSDTYLLYVFISAGDHEGSYLLKEPEDSMATLYTFYLLL